MFVFYSCVFVFSLFVFSFMFFFTLPSGTTPDASTIIKLAPPIHVCFVSHVCLFFFYFTFIHACSYFLPLAKAPKWDKWKSFENPSIEEYWHIGETFLICVCLIVWKKKTWINEKKNNDNKFNTSNSILETNSTNLQWSE